MVFRLFLLLQFVAVSVLGDAIVDPNDAHFIIFAQQKYFSEDQRENKILDPENAITREGWKCEFPFQFRGEWYSGCMTSFYNFPWCSTVKSFDWRNDHWGYCQNNAALTQPMTTYSGQRCHFPFTYQGIDYYGCTTFDHPRQRSWCMVEDEETGTATTTKDLCRNERNAEVVSVSVLGGANPDPNDAHFLLFAQQKYLSEDQRENKILDPENAITKEGWKCEFPFQFMGEWYSGCMTSFYKFPWCSTVRSFDWRNDHWGYCQINAALTHPMTTYSGKRCHFPFTYQGIDYYGCTTFDHPRHRSWCMVEDEETGTATTTKDLCRDERNAEVDTFGGESYGAKCQFPFVYEGKTYHGCTNDHSSTGQFWCLTKYQSWGYCNTIDSETNLKAQRTLTGEIYQKSSCVFPFVYGGKYYHGCAGRFQWCSETDNYDRDGMWKYCDYRDVMGVATHVTTSCTYPYLSNGTQWAEPFNMGSECANKYDLDGNHKLLPNTDFLIPPPSPPGEKIPTNLSLEVKRKCPSVWYRGTVSYIGCAIGDFGNWCPKSFLDGGFFESWNCDILDTI